MPANPFSPRDAAEISLRLPSTCTFRNSIGSSETGAYGFFDIPPLGEGLEGIVPVGTGVPDKEIMVCDAEGNAILSGETGEIVVTSSFGASGYWRQHDLTESRFVALADGRTSYHTGDLGRWLPNGTLLHLGRSDGMMKIRGYLVEPAEVEAALLDTGLVHEAAAFGVVGHDGAPSLHAYVVPIDGLRSSNAAIRRALRERVPEYLVPSSLAAVSELPKNDNGKIDRAQLQPVTETEGGLTLPRDEWERSVAWEWCTILGLDQVGVDDDFFSLGGDSLAVLELITAMADDHGVTIRSSDLVECPTLGLFAARARNPRFPPRAYLYPWWLLAMDRRCSALLEAAGSPVTSSTLHGIWISTARYTGCRPAESNVEGYLIGPPSVGLHAACGKYAGANPTGLTTSAVTPSEVSSRWKRPNNCSELERRWPWLSSSILWRPKRAASSGGCFSTETPVPTM